MNWTHAIVIVVALLIGAYLGVKQPSLVSKVTMGVIA
jgi:hypothetical protein